jgi:hypothetical protein
MLALLHLPGDSQGPCARRLRLAENVSVAQALLRLDLFGLETDRCQVIRNYERIIYQSETKQIIAKTKAHYSEGFVEISILGKGGLY